VPCFEIKPKFSQCYYSSVHNPSRLCIFVALLKKHEILVISVPFALQALRWCHILAQPAVLVSVFSQAIKEEKV
jgi:hypothetical protein